nr:hypothetical protein [Streptomyces tricolor]
RARGVRAGRVFRIDHYLGKETVQNIPGAALRQPDVQAIWNRSCGRYVQITMAEEDIGIDGRAGYYDGISATRDVIQNHLLQLMALTAMENTSRSTRTRCSPSWGC